MCLVLPREHLGEKDVREVNKEAREQMYSFWGGYLRKIFRNTRRNYTINAAQSSRIDFGLHKVARIDFV